MQVSLPFDILPTASIVNAPSKAVHYHQPMVEKESVSQERHQPAIIQSMSSNTTTKPSHVSELEEEQGKKILSLIYERSGTIEKKGTAAAGINARITPKHHTDSFYISKQATTTAVTNGNEKKMDFLDKVTDYLGIETKRSIRHIDRELLIENEITMKDLIGKCDLSITDLKNAGIVTSVKHLRQLDFKMSDVVINRERFQAQQLADLFGLNYNLLRKMKGVEFGTIDLLTCKFSPNELQALSFSFDRLIREGDISAKQIKALKFSLADLISLQFVKEHLEILGITKEDALQEFKWDHKEYAAFVK